MPLVIIIMTINFTDAIIIVILIITTFTIIQLPSPYIQVFFHAKYDDKQCGITITNLQLEDQGTWE